MINNITRRLGKVVIAEAYDVADFGTFPGDKYESFFRMQFRYGPKDLLQAQGHIPCKLCEHYMAYAILIITS